MSYFWAILLISAIITILEDFGSLLPARTVTVKYVASKNKNVHNLFSKLNFKKLLSASHREALCARPGTRESNETGGLIILKELLTLPMLSL